VSGDRNFMVLINRVVCFSFGTSFTVNPDFTYSAGKMILMY
jgi:hypothetical protein